MQMRPQLIYRYSKLIKMIIQTKTYTFGLLKRQLVCVIK